MQRERIRISYVFGWCSQCTGMWEGGQRARRGMVNRKCMDVWWGVVFASGVGGAEFPAGGVVGKVFTTAFEASYIHGWNLWRITPAGSTHCSLRFCFDCFDSGHGHTLAGCGKSHIADRGHAAISPQGQKSVGETHLAPLRGLIIFRLPPT